jgi:hypothetical protein
MVVLGSNHADAAFGRTKPVLNIVDAPIFTGSKETPALKDVEKAIRAAAVEERWVVTTRIPQIKFGFRPKNRLI